MTNSLFARRVLIVGDSLQLVKTASDTSLALAEAALTRGAEVHWCTPEDVGILGADVVVAKAQRILLATASELRSAPVHSTEALPESCLLPLTHYSDVWVRKDPPFDEPYKTLCWILATQSAVPVVNPAELLLAHHEKALQLRARAEGVLKDWELIPTCVTSNTVLAKAFVQQYEAAASHLTQGQAALKWVVKPWLGHGGYGVEAFEHARDALAYVETHTAKAARRHGDANSETTWMLQPFLPQVRTLGDRRVFLVAGEILCDFVRIPKEGHIASNLAQGGRPELVPMTDQQRNICERLAEWLSAKGILIAGVDLIDTLVGEINITSPTGLRTFEQLTGQNVATRAVELLFERSAQ